MEERKTCRTCTYIPCTKVCCKIDAEACNDYKSTVQAEIERIDGRSK